MIIPVFFFHRHSTSSFVPISSVLLPSPFKSVQIVPSMPKHRYLCHQSSEKEIKSTLSYSTLVPFRKKERKKVEILKSLLRGRNVYINEIECTLRLQANIARRTHSSCTLHLSVLTNVLRHIFILPIKVEPVLEASQSDIKRVIEIVKRRKKGVVTSVRRLNDYEFKWFNIFIL